MFDKMPITIIKILVKESAKNFKFFSAKGGASSYFSPRMIVHGRGIEYEKHCKFAFENYMQAHEDPKIKIANSPRTLDCIYL
jgi:hypothetical protein